MFKFPNVMVIKGGNEVIHMNLATSHISYLQLPGSIAVIGKNQLDDFKFSAILDFNEMFGKIDFTVDEKENVFQIIFHHLPIFKSVLPNCQLLGLFDNMHVQIRNMNNINSSILHFEDMLVTYGEDSMELRSYKEISRKKGEVLTITGLGLIHYKKGGKTITLVQLPLNFRSVDKEVNLYNSNNFLNRVIVQKSKKGDSFYIADESKYLKFGRIEDEDGQLYIQTKVEYYVSEDFDGSQPFSVVGKYLITKTRIIKLQIRGRENSQLNTESSIAFGKARKLPILSDDTMLLTYDDTDKDTGKKVSYMVMTPSMRNSSIPIVKDLDVDPREIKYVYFYYSEDLEEEFIVYVRQMDESICLEFFHLNGKLLCTKDFPISGAKNGMDYFDISLSNNGKYLLIYECYAGEKGMAVESSSSIHSVNAEDNDLKRSRRREKKKKIRESAKEKEEETKSWAKVDANVYEIVLVRSASRQIKINNLVTKFKDKVENETAKLKEYIKRNILYNVNCELKLLRRIEGAENRIDFN